MPPAAWSVRPSAVEVMRPASHGDHLAPARSGSGRAGRSVRPAEAQHLAHLHHREQRARPRRTPPPKGIQVKGGQSATTTCLCPGATVMILPITDDLRAAHLRPGSSGWLRSWPSGSMITVLRGTRQASSPGARCELAASHGGHLVVQLTPVAPVEAASASRRRRRGQHPRQTDRHGASRCLGGPSDDDDRRVSASPSVDCDGVDCGDGTAGQSVILDMGPHSQTVGSQARPVFQHRSGHFMWG